MIQNKLKYLDSLERIFWASLGVIIFIFAINMLKGSIQTLSPLLNQYLGNLDKPINFLGFGWFTSYLILSGSPIAALSLSIFDGGVISQLSSFFMVAGSRLGAAFILVIIGLVEYFRGESDLIDSTSVAFLTFLLTYLVFIPGTFVSYLIINSDFVNLLQFKLNPEVIAGVNSLFNPGTSFLIDLLGNEISFFASIGVLYFGLYLFDKAFQNLEVEKAKSSWINYLMRNPYFSFALGASITFAAQSVSLSLGIIVPLYLKGYLQRRDLIPYIMGANLATFSDTLLVAIILSNVLAVQVVLSVILGNLIITIIALIFYRKFHDFIVNSMNFLMTNKSALIVFNLLILIIPIILLFI